LQIPMHLRGKWGISWKHGRNFHYITISNTLC
jgi:hypothetical protein